MHELNNSNHISNILTIAQTSCSLSLQYPYPPVSMLAPRQCQNNHGRVKSKIKTEVEHSGSLSALADDVELDSFTDVAVDETTESKAKKSKIKTEL